MAKAFQLRQLRDLDDEKLVFRHDVIAENTSVGLEYFMQEIARRDAVRAAEANDRLARASHQLAGRSYWLSVISAATSVAALIVAVVTLVATAK